MRFRRIDIGQGGGTLPDFPRCIRDQNGMLSILVEKMQLAKEAKLIPVPNIRVVLVHRPEETIIALVSGVETVAQMNAQGILTCSKLVCHIIRSELDSTVVVSPARIKAMVRSSLAINSH